MKTFFSMLIMMLMCGLVFSANAAGEKIDSMYTGLEGEGCKKLENNADEGWVKSQCAGVAGYKLDWMEGDLRQTINVIDPNGKEHALELWSVVSSGFSSLGNKAEWRFRKAGGGIMPIALIVRYNVNEDPENPEKMTSYLTVSKITADEICVTAIVKPASDANIQARALADVAADKPCLGNSDDASANESGSSLQLEGTITGYECGDNCYLNVKDDKGEEYSGLCTAPLCDSWNEVAAMPDSFIGKKVKITVGEGMQVDGSGNEMGTMDSFDEIELQD